MAFNIMIVEATHDLVAAYKSNVAFYGGFGAEGLKGLQLTNEYIHSRYPRIPLLADCKRNEMGGSATIGAEGVNTSEVTALLETLKPYLINFVISQKNKRFWKFQRVGHICPSVHSQEHWL